MDLNKNRKRIRLNVIPYFILTIIFTGLAIFEWTSFERSIFLVILFSIISLFSLYVSIVGWLFTDEVIEESNKNIKKRLNPDSSLEDQQEHENRIRERLREVLLSKRSTYQKKFYFSLVAFIIGISLAFGFIENLNIILFVLFFSAPTPFAIYYSFYAFGNVDARVEEIIARDSISKWLD